MAQPPILTLSEISLTFGGDLLFEGLDLVVNPGERICLVGRNGSGKSTLMKIIAGLVEPENGERFLRPGAHVAHMEQDPDFTGFDTLFDWAVQDLDASQHYRAEMAMEGVKLNAGQSPDAASGGEKRRAALVRLLAGEADLLLLDEPTNHLDIEAITWLENYLGQAKQAFILISHDRAFLRNLTRATLWVDRGQVRRLDRGFAEFEAWRDKHWEEEDLAAHKLNRLIKSEARWAVEGISARRKRNMGRVRRLQDLRQQRADRIKRPGVAKLEFEGGSKSGKLVIEAKGIGKAFGQTPIIRDFSIRIARGERVAFAGPNGVGKTTLLKLLTGEIAPDQGVIRLGTNLIPAVFDQNREAVSGDETLWANLVDDPDLGARGKNDMLMVRGRSRHVVAYLKDFLFSDKQARSPLSSLSGGERARLLLARIMAKESNLLILDEPTNDLDVETLDLLQELLDEYDGTVLLVSHDRDFLDRVATTTIWMEGEGGATVYAGGWSDMLAQRGEVFAPDAPVKQKPKKSTKPVQATKPAAVNTQKIERLEREMERLQAEIAKLEAFLSDPELFTREPVKFQKASDGLAERQEKLAEIEEAWLEACG